MGAYSYINGKKIKFWKVQNIEFEEFAKSKSVQKYIDNKETNFKNNSNLKSLENGTIIISNDKDGLYIKAKEGVISVLEIQGENAKRMNINDFLRGNKLQVNEKFY